MTRPYLMLIALVAGCQNSHLVGGTEATGYLGGDPCSQYLDESRCIALGCGWITPTCPAGADCPSGVCYQPDPCLKLADAASCTANGSCAWSDAATLCPVGAECGNGGYCHPKDPSGGDCACVTPLACPAGADCPKAECDCSGGGSGGGSGGSCTCVCPACAPGEACPPCDCNCSDGGGSGCVDQGTCTCACPECPPGSACAPCQCDCAPDGPVSPDGTTSNTSMTSPDPSAPDPCSALTDQTSCLSLSSTKCQWFDLGAPCASGEPCVSGVCQTASSPPSMGCGCACPACAPGVDCPPCQCECTDGSGGCVPPEPPPTGGGGTTCPAIGCAQFCPNGYKKDASGCDTCECL